MILDLARHNIEQSKRMGFVQGDPAAHQIYIFGGTLTVRYSYFHDSPNGQSFQAAFPAGTGAGSIVDTMFANAGVTPTDAERQALVNELTPNPDSATLRAVICSFRCADSPGYG